MENTFFLETTTLSHSQNSIPLIGPKRSTWVYIGFPGIRSVRRSSLCPFPRTNATYRPNSHFLVSSEIFDLSFLYLGVGFSDVFPDQEGCRIEIGSIWLTPVTGGPDILLFRNNKVRTVIHMWVKSLVVLLWLYGGLKKKKGLRCRL